MTEALVPQNVRLINLPTMFDSVEQAAYYHQQERGFRSGPRVGYAILATESSALGYRPPVVVAVFNEGDFGKALAERDDLTYINHESLSAWDHPTAYRVVDVHDHGGALVAVL